MFSKATAGYANRMNAPVRDTTPVVAPLTQANAASADGHDFWDALWTLDDDWHPDPTPFGGGPGLPDFLMIL
ncbi:MAG TPA: hypothetical protein VKB69_12550 [Micromonosporaceae bacterium]|nr:hypothetical protein [Micromonosporaceae bacterium]